jgi:hypothetical protein
MPGDAPPRCASSEAGKAESESVRLLVAYCGGPIPLKRDGFMHYRAVQEALAEVGVRVELPTSPAVARVSAR